MTRDPLSPPVPAVEATLIAHRRLLRLLLAEAAARDPGLIERAAALFAYRDAHEDPGSEPDLAFAIEIAAERELTDLLRSAGAPGAGGDGDTVEGSGADRGATAEPGPAGARSAREGDF